MAIASKLYWVVLVISQKVLNIKGRTVKYHKQVKCVVKLNSLCTKSYLTIGLDSETKIYIMYKKIN